VMSLYVPRLLSLYLPRLLSLYLPRLLSLYLPRLLSTCIVDNRRQSFFSRCVHTLPIKH
jgi:hypothetical protein